MPAIQEFFKNDSYLRRLTALQACALMAIEMNSDSARIEILPKLLEMSADTVSRRLLATILRSRLYIKLLF